MEYPPAHISEHKLNILQFLGLSIVWKYFYFPNEILFQPRLTYSKFHTHKQKENQSSNDLVDDFVKVRTFFKIKVLHLYHVITLFEN